MSGKAGAKKPSSGNVQIRLSAEQLQRIDELRGAMMIVPSRSKTIRYLIDCGLAKQNDVSDPD